MSLVERIENLHSNGVSIDVMTMVFRSEGISDTDISEAYTEIAVRGTTLVFDGGLINWKAFAERTAI